MDCKIYYTADSGINMGRIRTRSSTCSAPETSACRDAWRWQRHGAVHE